MSDALKTCPKLNDLFLAHVKNCKQCRTATDDGWPAGKTYSALCFKGIRLLTGKPPPTRSDGGAA